MGIKLDKKMKRHLYILARRRERKEGGEKKNIHVAQPLLNRVHVQFQ
jgi:hypothetical protein